MLLGNFGFFVVARAQGDRSLQPGTVLTVRMNAGLSSETSRSGDKFTATVTQPVTVDGNVLVPAGSTVEGHVTTVEPAKRLSKSGTIAVDFDRLVLKDGRAVAIVAQLTSLNPDERREIDAEEGEVQGRGATQRNVIFIGGGAGVGAVIGAVAGGNAGVGAGVGSGLGTAAVLLSKGKEAVVPAGYDFGVELLRAVRFPEEAGASVFETRDDILHVQSYLRDRGFYSGPIDGRLSTATRSSVVRLQRELSLEQSGSVDVETARAVGLVADTYERGEAVKVLSVDTPRRPNGSVDVTIAAQTNTGGWSVYESHFVAGDTLHVYLRGVPPSGPATQALTRHEVRLTVAPDEARGLATYVVHGTGPDLTGQIGQGTGGDVDLRVLDQRVTALKTSYEQALGIRAGRLGAPVLAGRGYTDDEIELYFAVSSLANATRLYATVAQSLRSDPAMKGASQSLVREARQFDRLVSRVRSQRASGVVRDWSAVRPDFARIASSIQTSLERDGQ